MTYLDHLRCNHVYCFLLEYTSCYYDKIVLPSRRIRMKSSYKNMLSLVSLAMKESLYCYKNNGEYMY